MTFFYSSDKRSLKNIFNYYILFFRISPPVIPLTAEDIQNDEVVKDNEVEVFIDPKAIMYLLGTKMDYKEDKFSSSFVFNNPNETERCGCGESFKI